MQIKKTVLIISLMLISGLLSPSDYQIKVIQDAGELPSGLRTLGKAGDYFLSDGTVMALIGNTERKIKTQLLHYPLASAKGILIGFMPDLDLMNGTVGAGIPLIKSPEKYSYPGYDNLHKSKDAREGSLSFTASGHWQTKDDTTLKITTVYCFQPGENRVKITSSIKNTGEVPAGNIDYSLAFLPYHSYSFMPLRNMDTGLPDVRIYPKESHAIAWTGRKPSRHNKNLVPGTLAPGTAYSVEYTLQAHTSTGSLLRQLYNQLSIRAETLSLHLEGMTNSMAEIIIENPVSKTVLFRSFLESESLDIPIPAGVYSVRANFFPAVVEEIVEVRSGEQNLCHLRNPPQGKVHILVHDPHGNYVPAKVSFTGLYPTRSPYFKPENPMKTGKEWERRKKSCFPPEEGLSLSLPSGSYLATASRGPEYSIDHEVIEVLENSIHLLEFELEHILDTPRLVSIDPHMHTLLSDGSMRIAERLRSVIAEGVDVAVATDHNTLTDYSPTLKKINMEKYLSVIIGNEITHDDLIHYNSFPLSMKPDEEGNGAVDPSLEDAGGLFDSSRKSEPDSLIQVNHPRSFYQGYFHTHRLDLESAAYVSEKFSMNFDLLEVMNGPWFSFSNLASVEDWLHLLNRGEFFPSVGSSDSHGIDGAEPGYSRTYIIFEERQIGLPPTSDMVERLKKGHCFVSNGPIIKLRVNDRFIPGDLVTPASIPIKVSCRVECAPWVSADEVRLILNGERRQVFPIESKGASLLRFDKEIELSPEQDITVIVEVIGRRSLYPVLQGLAQDGNPEYAARPYALTNPVFIDIDGNGRFDPPVQEKIRLIEDPPPQKGLVHY